MASIAYYELPSLEQVYLEDSFVLECIETETGIVFFLDLVLTPGHEQFASAKDNEQHCYCYGKLVFKNPSAVVWKRKEFKPAMDASGSVDFGNIDFMVLDDGVYHLAGSWGDVTIRSDPATIVLT